MPDGVVRAQKIDIFLSFNAFWILLSYLLSPGHEIHWQFKPCYLHFLLFLSLFLFYGGLGLNLPSFTATPKSFSSLPLLSSSKPPLINPGRSREIEEEQRLGGRLSGTALYSQHYRESWTGDRVCSQKRPPRLQTKGKRIIYLITINSS